MTLKELEEVALSDTQSINESAELERVIKDGLGLDQVSYCLSYFLRERSDIAILDNFFNQHEQLQFITGVITTLISQHDYIAFSLAINSFHQIPVIIDKVNRQILVNDPTLVDRTNHALLLTLKKELGEAYSITPLVSFPVQQTKHWSCGVHVVTSIVSFFNPAIFDPNLPFDEERLARLFIRAAMITAENKHANDIQADNHFRHKMSILQALTKYYQTHHTRKAKIQRLMHFLQEECYGHQYDASTTNPGMFQHESIQKRRPSAMLEHFSSRSTQHSLEFNFFSILITLTEHKLDTFLPAFIHLYCDQVELINSLSTKNTRFLIDWDGYFDLEIQNKIMENEKNNEERLIKLFIKVLMSERPLWSKETLHLFNQRLRFSNDHQMTGLLRYIYLRNIISSLVALKEKKYTIAAPQASAVEQAKMMVIENRITHLKNKYGRDPKLEPLYRFIAYRLHSIWVDMPEEEASLIITASMNHEKHTQALIHYYEAHATLYSANRFIIDLVTDFAAASELSLVDFYLQHPSWIAPLTFWQISNLVDVIPASQLIQFIPHLNEVCRETYIESVFFKRLKDLDAELSGRYVDLFSSAEIYSAFGKFINRSKSAFERIKSYATNPIFSFSQTTRELIYQRLANSTLKRDLLAAWECSSADEANCLKANLDDLNDEATMAAIYEIFLATPSYFRIYASYPLATWRSMMRVAILHQKTHPEVNLLAIFLERNHSKLLASEEKLAALFLQFLDEMNLLSLAPECGLLGAADLQKETNKFIELLGCLPSTNKLVSVTKVIYASALGKEASASLDFETLIELIPADDRMSLFKFVPFEKLNLYFLGISHPNLDARKYISLDFTPILTKLSGLLPEKDYPLFIESFPGFFPAESTLWFYSHVGTDKLNLYAENYAQKMQVSLDAILQLSDEDIFEMIMQEIPALIACYWRKYCEDDVRKVLVGKLKRGIESTLRWETEYKSDKYNKINNNYYSINFFSKSMHGSIPYNALIHNNGFKYR